MSSKKEFEAQAPQTTIRITLTSTKVDALERICKAYVKNCRVNKIKIRGPLRLPTKTLTVYCRKSPVGQGTATFDHYEMRIHKRYIDFLAPLEKVRTVTNVKIDSGVDVDVTIRQD